MTLSVTMHDLRQQGIKVTNQRHWQSVMMPSNDTGGNRVKPSPIQIFIQEEVIFNYRVSNIHQALLAVVFPEPVQYKTC